jgi:exonuclease SbcD
VLIMGEPFRFLHAADFHLEQPPYALAEVPPHLRPVLIDAPLAAARQVFEAAILEEVDFVVLAGDVADCRSAGPQVVEFLLEQFQLLADRGIAVYWAGGQVDPPEQWPEAAPLPNNVHVFSRGRVEAIAHARGDRRLAVVMGHSSNGTQPIRAADYLSADSHGDTGELFSVAVAHGEADAESLAAQDFNYWALGGQHHRKTLFNLPHTAHYAGSPQGRCPSEVGAHGCTLVHVDHAGKVRTQLITTDAIRWHNERIELGQDETREDLERLLRDRTQNLVAEATDRSLLVSWTIAGAGRLSSPLRHGGLADELVAMLRYEFAHGQPAAVWTVSLELDPPAQLPLSLYEEDTILGDFLRAVRDHQTDESLPLEFDTYLSERHLAGTLAPSLRLAGGRQRARVLHDAATLAVDLLRGDEWPTE